MNFERLEQAWNSHANDPPRAAMAYLTEEVMADLKKRRRGLTGLLAWGAFALLAETGLVISAAMDEGVVELSREWGILLPFALGWIVLAIVLRHFQRHLDRHPDPHLSMPATLAALIDFNRGEMWRVRVMAGAFALLLVAIAITVVQLEAVGKMTPGNVRDMGTLFGLFLASLGVYAAWRYFRVLKPEHDRLVRLRQDYTEGAERA
jgi:hypothetical protein